MLIENLKSRIQTQNRQVIAHEEAHKAAAGPQAVGNPVYQKQMVTFRGETMEMITGGHQKIAMPAMVSFKSSIDDINRTIKAAKFVIAGAEAPADALSAADISVAAKGRQILFSAQNAKAQKETKQTTERKGLNYLA